MNVRRTISQPSATLARLTSLWLMSPTVTLSLFLVASLVAEANANRFSRVIAFGESSTDSGNVFELSEAQFSPSPPYFNGGWSNGPVWLDMVSEQLGFGLSVPSLRWNQLRLRWSEVWPGRNGHELFRHGPHHVL